MVRDRRILGLMKVLLVHLMRRTITPVMIILNLKTKILTKSRCLNRDVCLGFCYQQLKMSERKVTMDCFYQCLQRSSMPSIFFVFCSCVAWLYIVGRLWQDAENRMLSNLLMQNSVETLR